MRVEFIESGSSDCPLIRIYGTTAGEFERLQRACEDLANGSADSFSVQNLLGFEAVDDCSLIFAAGPQDKGTMRRSQKEPHFELVLMRKRWNLVAGLLEPFAQHPLGSYHQWLSGKEAIGELSNSKISVVISSHQYGAW